MRTIVQYDTVKIPFKGCAFCRAAPLPRLSARGKLPPGCTLISPGFSLSTGASEVK